jgi:hypothetical protein
VTTPKVQRALKRAQTITGGVRGKTGGRADALPVDVPAGAYVIPADVVAALGEGNTEAGMHALDRQFGRARRANGGAVPIRISDGEYVVSPEAVERVGGHDAFDELVLSIRARYADHLKRLPGPNGSGAGRADGGAAERGPWEDYAPVAAPAAERGPWEDYAPSQPSPAAGSRAAAEDAEGRRQTTEPPSRMRYLSDLTEKLGQGVFANYGDEIAATAGALPNIITGGRLGKSRSDILNDIREREQRFDEENPIAATTAEIAGGILPAVGGGIAAARALPALASRLASLSAVPRAAATGALGGAGYGAVNETGELREPGGIGDYARAAGEGALEGGIGGGIAGGGISALGHGVARTVGPWASEAAQRLHDRGIRLTAGQLVGGQSGNWAGRQADKVEQAFTSIPLVNALVRHQRNRAVEDLNRVALNEVLEPIGQKLPADARMGRDAIAAAHTAISDAYERVVPALRADWSPQAVGTELARIRARVPRELQGRFDDIVEQRVTNVKNPATSTLQGHDVQHALAGLKKDASGYKSGPASLPHDHKLGQALDEVRDTLVDSIKIHSHPDAWEKFRNTQRAFERLVRVERAAASTAAPGGVFNPEQLHSAVKLSDRSPRRNDFARGMASMQRLSEDARSVMGQGLADTGTPERTALMAALSYGPTATTLNPWLLAGPAAVGAAYTTPAQAIARRLIAGSAARRAAVRRAIEAGSRAIEPAAGPVGYQAVADSDICSPPSAPARPDNPGA